MHNRSKMQTLKTFFKCHCTLVKSAGHKTRLVKSLIKPTKKRILRKRYKHHFERPDWWYYRTV